jgi:hypothetical protein
MLYRTEKYRYAKRLGHAVSHVEQPEYKLINSKGNIELRDYSPMILAEVDVLGERKQAARKGFKILANYIFGNNASETKMEMTAPVIEEQVMNKWKVRFVMPKKYSFETLPKPNAKEVTLVQLPAKRFAVIQFTGLPDEENLKDQAHQLKAYILAENLVPLGGAILAFYNRPSTPPLLRRNEVMIEIRN